MSIGRCLLALLPLVLLGWACSKPAEPANPPTPPQTNAPAASAADGAANPAAPGAYASLAGTAWEVGKYVLEFSEEPKVHISGEAVPIPGGINGQYSVKDGAITVGAAGQSKSGTWDGSSLVLEGVNAKRKAS